MTTERLLKNYINGEWVTSHSTTSEPVFNPATGDILCSVPLSNLKDLDFAVQSSEKAFELWKLVPVTKRVAILFKFQQLVVSHKQELAELITKENGKNIKEALGEVQRGIENIEFATSVPSLMMGDSLSSIATHVEAVNYRYPIGVVGGITPFNFPMMVPCWMFPMAIACGNSFILKPSEKTPLLAEKLVSLFSEAGLPEGVLNVVYGAHEIVDGLLEHPTVKAISFVGSKPVGEHVFKKGSDHLKRVQVLAGAKNHSIVLKDANLDETIPNIIGAAFGSAGERCMAATVIAVEDSIADDFMAALVTATENITIGEGLDGKHFLGPVIRADAQARLFSDIEEGLSAGATLVCDGRTSLPEEGYFVGPTIFDNVTTEMSLWQKELFGPVLSIIRVKDLMEGVALANQSEFANGACLFTNNASAIRYFRENIDAGMLGINLGVPAPMAIFPFSGWKSSFYGTLHANGKDSVDFYTRKKVVTARYPLSNI